MGKGPMWDRISVWIADRLPRRIVYFVTMRLWTHAISGRFRHTDVADLTVGEALHRWQMGAKSGK